MTGEEPIIRDHVSNFSDEDWEHDVHESGEPSNQSQCESSSYFETIKSQLLDDLQFSNLHSFNFDVEENKSDKYVVKCIQYGNGCHWRERASFSKIRKRWEMKKINGIHTCTTLLISPDHVRLDSSVIVCNIVHLVKTNPGIQIKTLIANMLQRFVYTVTYKKAWTTKQKALEIAFES